MEEKGFRQLRVDPEFKNLIPPLRREEYRQLELNLVMEGCREDIIVWNDTIVDGHNRYEICNKLQIPYGVKEQAFSSRAAVIVWICSNQLGVFIGKPLVKSLVCFSNQIRSHLCIFENNIHILKYIFAVFYRFYAGRI